MRNRFKNSTIHQYNGVTGNVELTIGAVGTTPSLTFTVYGPNGTIVDVTDSYGVTNSYNITSNNNLIITADAHLIGSKLTLTSNQMTRFAVGISGGYSQVSKIEILDEGGLTSLNNMANGSTLLTEFVSVDLPNVTDMGQAFRDTAITVFPDIDVSNVTDVGIMFYGCSELTAINANFSGVTVKAAGFTTGCTKLKCIAGITTYSTTDTTSSGMFGSSIMVTPTEYEKDQLINNPNGYSYLKPAYLTACSFGLFEIDLVKFDSVNSISIRVYGLDANISCTVIDTTGTSTTYTASATFLNISGIDVSGASNTIKITMPNVSNFRITSAYVKEAHIINEGTLKDLTLFNSNYNSKLDTFTSVPLNYVDSVESMFWYNTSLTSIPVIDLPFCRKYRNFVKGCNSITSFPSNWVFDVANDLNGMFYNCSGLISLPQLDFPRGTDFTDAFRSCTSLTTFTGVTFSQVAGDVVLLSNTWSSCSSLTSMPSIDVSKVTNLYSTWNSCSALTSFPSINTTSITNIGTTWYNCSGLTSFPQLDFTNVTYADSTWRGCSSLTSFPAINFPNLSTTFRYMWRDCIGLTSFPLITINSTHVNGIDISYNWFNCNSLTSFPAIDLSTATNIKYAWSKCSSMVSWSVPNVPNNAIADFAFDSCSLISSIIINLSNASSISGMFRSCSSLTVLEDTAGSGTFSTPSATSVSELFRYCTSLITTPILDVSSATTAYNMFGGCSSLQHVKGLGTTGNITNMGSMFYGCSNLICLDAMDGTSSQVTNDPANVFFNCTSLTAPNATEQVDIIDNNINWVNPNPCPNPYNGVSFTLQGTNNLEVNVTVDLATTLNVVHSDGSLQDIAVAAGSTTLVTITNDGLGNTGSIYSPEMTTFKVTATTAANKNLVSSEILDAMKLNTLYRSYYSNYFTAFTSVGLPNVTSIQDTFRNSDLISFTCPDLSGVLDARYAFRGTAISAFNTDMPNCTDISNCWELTDFVTFPNINLDSVVTATSAWSSITTLNTFSLVSLPSATTLNYAWKGCNNMTSFPNISIPLASNLSYAWDACSSLTSFPTLSIPEATNLSYAWYNCNSLTSFPVLLYPKVTNINYAWYNCTSFTDFPASNFPLVINANNAWYACSGLATFSDSTFGSSVTLESAWNGCSSLVNFNVTSLSTATSLYNAWSTCSSLVTMPLIDISSCTNLGYAWRNCTSMTSIPLWVFSTSLTSLTATWSGCTALTTIANMDTSNITSINSSWENCTSLVNFPALDFSSVTNMSYAWQNCTGLTSLPNLNLGNVQDGYSTFNGCTNITSIQSSIGTGNTINKSFTNMFVDCTSLVCVQGIDTTEIANTPSTTNMFTNTPALLHPDATEQTALTSATGATYSYTGTC